MESAASIVRAKSEQLEIPTAAARTSLSRTASAEALATASPLPVSGELNGGSGISRKASFGKRVMGSSPGKKGGGNHIRKARSAQLKLDLEDVSSSAALSRASSASLGFSFSFTGFTAPPEDIMADLKGFSDEEPGIYSFSLVLFLIVKFTY